jgi:hypothetical protein
LRFQCPLCGWRHAGPGPYCSTTCAEAAQERDDEDDDDVEDDQAG